MKPGQLKINIHLFSISVKSVDLIPDLPRDYYLRSDGAFRITPYKDVMG